MKSKRKIIENCIKKHGDEGTWVSEIWREARVGLPTICKWVRILELEGKVKVEKFSNMKILRWRFDENGED